MKSLLVLHVMFKMCLTLAIFSFYGLEARESRSKPEDDAGKHNPYRMRKVFIVLLLGGVFLGACSTDVSPSLSGQGVISLSNSPVLPVRGDASVNRLLSSAFGFIRDEDYGRAEGVLLEVLALAPENPWAWLNLGVIWQKAGALDKAREAYQNAQSHPESERLFAAAELGSSSKRSLKELAQHNLQVLGLVTPADKLVGEVVVAVAVAVAENIPVSPEVAVSNALYSWATSWMNADLALYFLSYEPSFSGRFETSSDWRAYRSGMISGERAIRLQLSNVQMKFKHANLVAVTFWQSYSSANYSDEGCKSMVFALSDGRWLIKEEVFARTKEGLCKM